MKIKTPSVEMENMFADAKVCTCKQIRLARDHETALGINDDIDNARAAGFDDVQEYINQLPLNGMFRNLVYQSGIQVCPIHWLNIEENV